MSFFDFFSNLDFRVVHDQYPDLNQVPPHVPYSELEQISIALVEDLPPNIKALVGQEITEPTKTFGEFEQITDYTIKPADHNPSFYLITRYTNYQ